MTHLEWKVRSFASKNCSSVRATDVGKRTQDCRLETSILPSLKAFKCATAWPMPVGSSVRCSCVKEPHCDVERFGSGQKAGYEKHSMYPSTPSTRLRHEMQDSILVIFGDVPQVLSERAVGLPLHRWNFCASLCHHHFHETKLILSTTSYPRWSLPICSQNEAVPGKVDEEKGKHFPATLSPQCVTSPLMYTSKAEKPKEKPVSWM